MRVSPVVQAGRTIALSAVTRPLDFLRYVARYRRYRRSDVGDLNRAVQEAIEERTRSFQCSPPAFLLPQRRVEEICGEAHYQHDWHSEPGDGSELPEPEQHALVRIVKAYAPATIFEIGTYRGRTTKLLAACSPLSVVHTLDLSPSDMLDGGCFPRRDAALIGAQFSTDEHMRSRITQHFGDSRQFDFGPFYRKVDLVFVDASHAYEAVVSDSRQAFQMVRRGGIIVWDDYHPLHGPGVMRALAEVAKELTPLVWLKGTRLAVHYPGDDWRNERERRETR